MKFNESDHVIITDIGSTTTKALLLSKIHPKGSLHNPSGTPGGGKEDSREASGEKGEGVSITSQPSMRCRPRSRNRSRTLRSASSTP